MPGFVTVLKRIAGVWREKKDLIRQQSADTMRQLSEAMQPKGPLVLLAMLTLACTVRVPTSIPHL